MQADVVKNDQTPISIGLYRSPKSGLYVNVKVVPDVEEFMQRLGTGRKDQLALFGRHWYLDKDAVKTNDVDGLYVYDITELPGRLGGRNRDDDGTPNGLYRLDVPGHPLDYEGYVNLSFLRLVGISEGDGVGFYIKSQPASLEGMRALRDRIAKAARSFYIDYMKPVDMLVKIQTQQVAV